MVIAPARGSIPSVQPPGNVVYDDLSVGLRTAASMSLSDLRAVGRRNRDAAHTDHDWTDIARQVEQLYRRASADIVRSKSA
jgi:hypothetical protein